MNRWALWIQWSGIGRDDRRNRAKWRKKSDLY
nr:MAG TPA: hypothetical protein [Caudoviricetes sp.]